MGVFRWVEATVVEPSFFEVSAETSSLFLVLLDEVQTILLTPLSLLINVFYLDGIISFFTTSFHTRITPEIARGFVSINGSTDAGTIEETVTIIVYLEVLILFCNCLLFIVGIKKNISRSFYSLVKLWSCHSCCTLYA